MRKVALLAAAAAIALAALPAGATTLFGKITGTLEAEFQIDSSPTPTNSVPTFYFLLTGIAVTHGGGTSAGDLTFYNGLYGGGLNITLPGPVFLYASGPQIYNGPEDTPTFAPGTWSLWDDNGDTSELTLTAASVPEPVNWALMIGGFGLAGICMRWKRLGSTSLCR